MRKWLRKQGFPYDVSLLSIAIFANFSIRDGEGTGTLWSFHSFYNPNESFSYIVQVLHSYFLVSWL
ncbi:hypothetical protein [Peribacillus sp. ACCC06369]|uniref:hypothetical protein n=1 Tax=Peribacillus sp. ACCC06369 TaxID=3055860 RepID=UPI0025A1E320|nr:hypothetical protein [Peribacillus sp. ACCC06369]